MDISVQAIELFSKYNCLSYHYPSDNLLKKVGHKIVYSAQYQLFLETVPCNVYPVLSVRQAGLRKIEVCS